MSELPPRIAALPKDERGYPVPFFTGWVDGKPDLRTSDERKRRLCAEKKLCGVCGEPLEWWIAFITGPLGVANRYTSEPPLHEECARYSLAVCPHLSAPAAKATPEGKIPGTTAPVGGIRERPPQIALYLTRRFDVVPDRQGSFGFALGAAKSIEWFTPGDPRRTRETGG